MPFVSGNCRTPNEFLEAMISLATDNGWALLRGAASLADSGEFPVTARYFRVTCSNPQAGSTLVAGLSFRETVGGADIILDPDQLTASGFTDGFPPENVLDGLATTFWWGTPEGNSQLIYDFLTPQTIRQITLRAPSPSAGGMPRTLSFARSDDRINWDTFYVPDLVELWTAGETKLFTFPLDGTSTVSSTLSGGVRRPVEFWLQGPGYDAARRVFLGFRTTYNLSTGLGGLLLNAATSFDSTRAWGDMERSLTNYPKVALDINTEDLDYWIYVNSTRIIGILKSAAGDYASFYSGFLAAFANPDQHPFPLYVAGTTIESLDLAYNSTNAANGAFWDPGVDGGRVLDELGVWRSVGNQQSAFSSIRPIPGPAYWVWPWHNGGASSATGMFASISGNSNGSDSHLLNSLQPTLQDDLPTMDAIVMGSTYGAMGALQGVLAIPGGGVLTPETTIEVGASDYRTFPNRTRRLGNAWVGIQE